VVANRSSSSVSLLMGNGDGTFQAIVGYDAGYYPQELFASDFNGDQTVDVAVLTGYGAIVTLLNHSDTVLSRQYGFGINGWKPYKMHGSDLDGDGDVDLAVTGSSSYRDLFLVSILINDGNGRFLQGEHYEVARYVAMVYCSDLDGDGDVDIVSPNGQSSYNYDRVTVLTNNGDATFQPLDTYHVGGKPKWLWCSDFNGDGFNDMAIVSTGYGNTSILINNGDGTFQDPVDYGTGSGPIFGADFDSDGDVDLAVTGGGVSILLNNGDGTFQDNQVYSTGGSGGLIFCADFDQDSDQDIVVAQAAMDKVSVLLNYGDGTFHKPIDFLAGDNPVALSCADFDGDFDTDILVANHDLHRVSLLLNRSNMRESKLSAGVDFLPGSCSNTLNAISAGGGKGLVPVAVLGTEAFDVRNVDPGTVRLAGVNPVRWGYDDATTPVDKTQDSCACTEEGADGYEDLILKFDRQAVIASLSTGARASAVSAATGGIASDLDRGIGDSRDRSGTPTREMYLLRVEGALWDHSVFEGFDCVTLKSKSGGMASRLEDPPRATELIGNHPNPFNPATRLVFYIPTATHVNLAVYNILGQRVETLIDDVLEAGEHSVLWNGGHVASGVYFYRFHTPGYVDTRKMLLLK